MRLRLVHDLSARLVNAGDPRRDRAGVYRTANQAARPGRNPVDHIHRSPTLTIAAVQWPALDEPSPGITLAPGDWQIRMTVRNYGIDPDSPHALRELLEYALATLDHETQGPDALLDDPDA